MTAQSYLAATSKLLHGISPAILDDMVSDLNIIRDRGGRLFCLGNGGGAAHASHAAADFRKIARLESYAQDSVGDYTALINDDGWEASTSHWLNASHFDPQRDALLIFTVGGLSKTVSPNLYWACSYAKGAIILAITGRPGALYDNGYATNQLILNADTAQCEGIQSVVAHYLVSALA